MRWMIASDIHGSNYYCEMLIRKFNEMKADKLILLGDILYHGPRNDLPKDYAPKKVAALLNEYADKILCVRGNCEAEVDQMMLDFPALGDYAYLYLDGVTVYATHGHHAGEDAPPPIRNHEILMCGHTHVPKCAEHEGFVYINPGSVSIPKEGSAHSFITFSEGVFRWIDLETNEIYKEYRA
ncbi:MAG: phosphodiesterase [Clostridia bacterium]|nr:phosphodiesterase [Clostridia bacterium]